MATADTSGPKTTFSNQDSAGNLVTIFAEQSKRSAENKTIRRTLPGKSHVGRIILHDNTSQERLLDMKLADIKNSQRKMEAFMTHQKKTFLKRMEKKHGNWAREHARQAVEFNSKGTRSVGVMLEMMRANPERYGAGGRSGTPYDEVGASVTGEQIGDVDDNDDDQDSDKLPSLEDKDYSNAMSQARIPQRKLKHRTTGIPSLPTLFTLPTNITHHEEQNPFLTLEETDEEEDLSSEEPIVQVEKSNTRVSFSSNVKSSLPGLELRKVSVISMRSQTAPKEGITDRLPPVSNGKPRPETEPRNLLTTRHNKKSKSSKHEQSRLPGPEPTFISETLPRIDTSDPGILKLKSQHQSKKFRRAKKRARAKEAYRKEASRNPLSDERFVKLQSYLSPVPSERESQDLLKSLDRNYEGFDMDTGGGEIDTDRSY